MSVQQVKTLTQVYLVRSRQFLQMSQDVGLLLQVSGRQLPDHDRVRPDLPRLQAGLQLRISPVEVIDPDGGIDQDSHEVFAVFRRGAAVAFVSLPPSAASRAAASRWMRARRPSCSKAVFPFTPAYAPASSIRAVSRFSVVLMHMNLHAGSASSSALA